MRMERLHNYLCMRTCTYDIDYCTDIHCNIIVMLVACVGQCEFMIDM